MGKSVRTQEDRIRIRDEILAKLYELQLDIDAIYSLTPLKTILAEYTQPVISNSIVGKMKVPEIGRTLEFALPMRVWHEPVVRFTEVEDN